MLGAGRAGQDGRCAWLKSATSSPSSSAIDRNTGIEPAVGDFAHAGSEIANRCRGVGGAPESRPQAMKDRRHHAKKQNCASGWQEKPHRVRQSKKQVVQANAANKGAVVQNGAFANRTTTLEVARQSRAIGIEKREAWSHAEDVVGRRRWQATGCAVIGGFRCPV